MGKAHTAHVAVVEAMGVFAAHTTDGFIERVGGATGTVTGLGHPAFNHVTVTGEASADDLRLVALAVDAAGFPWCAMLRDGEDDDSWAEALGLQPADETVPLMVATHPRPAPWPDELDQARGAWTAGMHRALLYDAFDLPETMVDPLVTEELAADPAVDIVVGLSDGVPVTTAMAVRVGDAIGIFDVATTRDERGRGYGAAATWAVMEPAFAAGVRLASLQTSPLGRSVYERLGYEIVADHRRWDAAR
jgi:hypothetical protein